MNTDLGFVGVAAHKKSAPVAAPKKSVVEKRIIAMNMKQRPRAGNSYPTNPSEVPPIRSPPIFVHPPQPLPKLESPVRSTSEQLRYAGGEDYDYDEKYEKARAAKLEEAPSVSSEDIYYVHAGSGDEFEYPEEDNTAADETKDRGYHAHDIHIVRPKDTVKSADELKHREDAADAKNKVFARENRLPGVAKNPHNVHFFARYKTKAFGGLRGAKNDYDCSDISSGYDEPCSTDQFLAQIGQPIEHQKGKFLAEAGHPISDLGCSKETPIHPAPEKIPAQTHAPAPPAPVATPPPLSFSEFMNMYQLYKEFTRSGTI